MNGSEAKRKRTERSIIDAFFKLYKTKSFLNITVKEVCEQANINRSTFYAYYNNTEDLLVLLEDKLIREMSALSREIHTFDIYENIDKTHDVAPCFINLYRYFYEQKEYMTLLLSENGSPRFVRKFKNLIADDIKKGMSYNHVRLGENHDFAITYMTGGVVESVYQWLKNDTISTAEIASIMMMSTIRNPYLDYRVFRE